MSLIIDAAFLKQFCAVEDTKYVYATPGIFTTKDGRKVSYGTDGHQIVMVHGELKGCTPREKPGIEFAIIEPQGVEVLAADLKAFLECDKPTTQKCEECGGSGERDHECNCEYCHTRTEECGCDGLSVRIVNPGYLGIARLNRALLADVLRDVTDETVRVHVVGKESAVFVFTSEFWAGVMPMRDYDDGFKAAPKFILGSK